MKLPKVLLIAPTYIENPNTMYFPIGMSYLCSYLTSKGFEVDGFNMNNYGLTKGWEQLSKILENTSYDVIGVGGLTIAFEPMEALLKNLRMLSEAKIVLGGGITACESELVIQEIQPDYMIISEAELIFEELLLHIAEPLTYALPKGTWSYKNKNIEVANSDSYAIENLDDLPYPDYEKMGIRKFIELQTGEVWSHHKVDLSTGKYIPVSASRSCPFKCTFCYHAGMGKYRKHSVEYAVSFIKRLKEKYAINHFLIYDELFSLNKKRVMEFCNAVKPLNITFMCQLRVDQVDLEMLQNMKDAGCLEISYGIESGSNVIIDSMKKQITSEQIANAIKLTRQVHIGIQGNFLFGDPMETDETIKESLAFQEKHRLYFSDWSMVIPYPGTVLHSMALEKNMIKDRVQFIKDVADTSKYLWNTPINLTQYSNKDFINRYAQLRELNDENHRKVLSEITQSKVIDEKHSNMRVKCPYCSTQTEYKHFPFPFNIQQHVYNDRASFYGFLGINIVCPKCREKHHLLPKNIEHVKPYFKMFEEKLARFVSNHKDIVVMPAIDRYFSAIKEDTSMLDLTPIAVLDTREYRIDDWFLDQQVQPLNKDNIKKLEEKFFIIFPWVEAQKAYDLLIENGVKKDQILAWNIQ